MSDPLKNSLLANGVSLRDATLWVKSPDETRIDLLEDLLLRAKIYVKMVDPYCDTK